MVQKKEKNKKIDLFQLFPLHPNAEIHLDNYLCVIIGNKSTESNSKTVEQFKFIYCEKAPLKGRHLIEYNGKQMLISSPSDFQRNILQFKNNINFDKCTYIYHEEEDCLIRLLAIRNRIVLPFFNGNQSKNTYNYVFNNPLNIKYHDFTSTVVTHFLQYIIETLFYAFKSTMKNKEEFRATIDIIRMAINQKITQLLKQDIQEQFKYNILFEDFQQTLREPESMMDNEEYILQFELTPEDFENLI